MNERTEAANHSAEESEKLSCAANLMDLCGQYWLGGADDGLERLLADPEWFASLTRAGLVDDSSDLLEGKSASRDSHLRELESLLRIPTDDFVPPSEGGFRDRKKERGAAAIECRRIYNVAGYKMAPFSDQLPDHIGHQLRFLAALSRKEASCWDRDDAEAAVRVRGWREGFSTEHGWWWSRFAERIGERAESSQLRIMAAVLRGLSDRLVATGRQTS